MTRAAGVRTAVGTIAVLFGWMVADALPAGATAYTPMEWQQPVQVAGSRVPLRKHTTWIRDQNRNYIDDLIDTRFSAGESVDVIVDFNRFLAPSDLRHLLDGFGRVTYIAKLVTCVFVDRVEVSSLDSLVRHPDVALIEWQTEYRPTTDISTRSVQARASETYSSSAGAGSAEDMGARGSGINIAFLDTGVENGHAAFSTKPLVGFDATIFEDTNGNEIDDSCEAAGSTCTGGGDENGNGTDRDPEPASSPSHGSHIAGVALGSPGTETCRKATAPDDMLTGGCAGVAPDAGLVDVKVCPSETSCPPEDVVEGLDWVGLNAGRLGIQVANVSIADCYDDDGTTAAPQTVNALVSRGVAVVVGHGNAGGCESTRADGSKEPAGDVRTAAPGSASLAATVSGTDDSDTVTRSDDRNYAEYLKGPRKDYASTSEPRALKPDLCAPAAGVESATDPPDVYFLGSGTSVSSAHVAGAAAVIRGAKSSIDPVSLKDLLLRSADRTFAIFPTGKTWDEALGNGQLNLYAALSTGSGTDIGFTSCTGAPSAPGQPCYISSTVPSWSNYLDIETATPPEDGVSNKLYASVTNNGPTDATFLVDFGVYVFGAGNTQFHHLGSDELTLGIGETGTAEHAWTPASSAHQCAQVSISYGYDTDFENNVTQRNLSVAASTYQMRVENPLSVPARIRVVATSARSGWNCRVDPDTFMLDPLVQGFRDVRVDFHAPGSTPAGEWGDCNVEVRARPIGSREEVVLGGVTTRTYAPKSCRGAWKLLDADGRAIKRATVWLGDVPAAEKPRAKGTRKTKSGADGTFKLDVLPYRAEVLTVEAKGIGSGTYRFQPSCGSKITVLELTPEGLRERMESSRK